MKKGCQLRKQGIILSAVEIIDELGIHELSTREIAKRQNISEAALYKHFKSKKDIILAVLDYYSSFDLIIKQEIEEKNLGAKDSLIFLATSLCVCCESNPALTSIAFSCEIFRHDPDLAERIKYINCLMLNFIQNIIEEGKKSGEIRNSLETEYLADAFAGLAGLIMLKWRMNNCSFSLKEKIIQTVESFLDTI